MSTVVTLAAAASAEIRSNVPNVNYSSWETSTISSGTQSGVRVEHELLIAFASPGSSYLYKKITRFLLKLYSQSISFYGIAAALKEPFNENQVTWNNAPDGSLSGQGYTNRTTDYPAPYEYTANIPEDRLAMLCAKNGVRLSQRYKAGENTVYTSRGGEYAPSAEVTFDDSLVGPYVTAAYPQSGYINPAADNTFLWTVGTDGYCLGNVSQASAVFAWRPSGGQETTIALTTETSVTIPAGTFATGGIDWQVRITANNGLTTVTPWFTLSTADAVPVVTALSPSGIMVDGSRPISFEWDYSIASGTPQTKAEIQVSTDGVTTYIAGTVLGPEHKWIAPAGTFPAGPLYWVVRAYNTDDVPSAWSNYLGVTVVAASPAPAVTATSDPQMLISWQATGQEAAEISVDGQAAPIVWGGNKNYTWNEILGDGIHTARVRVQNSYGLWSEWGDYQVETTNNPGSAIGLSATVDEINVILAWNLNGSDEYQILRDGVVIASVSAAENAFIDDGAGAGTHTYQVRGIDAGNYTPSNEASVSCSVPGIVIKPPDEDWIVLGLTIANPQTINERYEKPASIVYYSGSELPEIEHSGQLSHVYSFKPSFPGDQAATAEKLISAVGKTVLIKDLYGAAFYGVISVIPRERTPHRQTFEISIMEVVRK